MTTAVATPVSAPRPAAPRSAPGPRGEPMDWRLWAILYAIIVVSLVAKALYNAHSVPLFLDTDDAMRLTNVHDLLAGQGWFDHIQHRLNVPYGGEIHWSRLVDTPQALVLLVLRPLAGPMADTILGYAYPLLLLGVLLYLSGRLALRLVGREGLLAALVIPAFSPSLVSEFAPGRLDHHSAQILLTLTATLCAVEALKRPRFAVGAGIAAMTALAIGAECLPVVAAIIVAFTLIWVFEPRRADALRGFGLSFGISGLVHLAIALPPDQWFAPACDALSIVYVAAGLGTGIVLIGLSLVAQDRGSAPMRFGLAAAGGLVLLLVLALLFPQCLKGPYAALDPWLVEHWLSHVSESKTMWESAQGFDPFTIGVTLPLVLALAAIAVRVLRVEADRGEWLVLGVIVLLAFLVTILQIRGARLATAPAIPAAAWVIAKARARYIARRRVFDIVGLLGSWFAFTGLILALLVILAKLPFENADAQAAEMASRDTSACLMPSAFAPLERMPPARILTPVDLGSHVLLYTPHSVVSAPYHRAQQGIRDTYRFFNDPIAVARSVLIERGVSLVVLCPQMAEIGGLPDRAPDSFAALYAKGKLPDWLADVTPKGGALKIYAVKP